ncbi:uncharacterized protein B0T23DRAFT_406181 [Neurospora hispaniola]|uniref:Uncharacterized protein n=1 Tax=Neurospora hispaniola TaxID=588809 RepID=A0AAJ0MPA3_9PEZI|nr:hypothetical protein B0T23DRAFT_406181 [Neurospora hispaniola]
MGCCGYIPRRQERGDSSPPRDHSSLDLPPGVRLSIPTRPLSSLPHIPAITASTLPPQVPPASVKSAVGSSINISSVGAREPATTGTKRELKRADSVEELLPSVPIGSSGIRVPLRDQLNAIVTYVSCALGRRHWGGFLVPPPDFCYAFFWLACSAMS